MAAGLLAATGGLAFGAYLVKLDGGDRMTVDSYWNDGDRVHLLGDGGDLIVPRARIQSIRPVGDAGRAKATRTAASSGPVSHNTVATPEELQARQNVIEHHMLRVQQERFEAEARGESAARLRRLEKEFRRTQQRRIQVMRALERAGESD